MKKFGLLLIILTLVMGTFLAACSPGTPTTPSTTEEELLLKGSAEEVLGQILDQAQLDQGTFDEPLDQDNCESYTGLSYSEIQELAADGFSSQAAINVVPHLVVVLQGKDKEAADQLKEAIVDKFDSHRWVCVMPDQSFVVTAGQYVLLAATNNEDAGKLKAAFAELAGSAADAVNEFFTFSAE